MKKLSVDFENRSLLIEHVQEIAHWAKVRVVKDTDFVDVDDAYEETRFFKFGKRLKKRLLE